MKPSNDLVTGDVSASFNSSPIQATFVLYGSVQATLSGGGSPVGVLKVQASNDQPLTGAPQNWNDLSSITVNVTADGSFLIPIFNLSYEWIRLVYTRTSGTGTASIRVKTIGA